MFNIGDNVNTQPNPAACFNTTGDDGSSLTGPSPVYQVWDDEKQCHRLGGDVTNDDNWDIDVINAE